MERDAWSDKIALVAAWRCGGAEGRRAATRLLYGALAVVSGWILLLPLVPGVTATVMRRFHLSTGSYGQWLPQQVVPAMYSFANEYRLSQQDVPVAESEAFVGATWVNHYPPRLFTFARRRGLGTEEFYLYCRSRYRGRELLTKTRVQPEEEGGFRMRLVEERFAVEGR
jgi:hypothetical protein